MHINNSLEGLTEILGESPISLTINAEDLDHEGKVTTAAKQLALSQFCSTCIRQNVSSIDLLLEHWGMQKKQTRNE